MGQNEPPAPRQVMQPAKRQALTVAVFSQPEAKIICGLKEILALWECKWIQELFFAPFDFHSSTKLIYMMSQEWMWQWRRLNMPV